MSETLCIYLWAILTFDVTIHVIGTIVRIVEQNRIIKAIDRGQLKIKQEEAEGRE